MSDRNTCQSHKFIEALQKATHEALFDEILALILVVIIAGGLFDAFFHLFFSDLL